MRQKMYLSVNKLGIITGVPRQTITKIENEVIREVPVESLKKLCKFFKCGIEDIIYFEKVEELEEAS